MTCKQTQQKTSPEVVMRRVQDNMTSFTNNDVGRPTIIMRDYKYLKMSLKTRIKIWLSRFRTTRTERHNVS